TLSMTEDELVDAFLVPTVTLRQFEMNPEHAQMKGAIKQSAEVRKTIRHAWDRRKENNLSESDLTDLQRATVKFETLLEYELSQQQIWSVEKVGIFDTAELIERAEDHLSEAAKKGLNERTLQDFRASGRCLAFHLFTASGYHAL